jgi:hypothetical protein
MNGIPKVKAWIVTTTSGVKHIVSAPTKRLALMNFRLGDGDWSPIKSIGLSRKLNKRD